jgi:protein ImuB
MRIACLLIPDLPLRAALRADPSLRGAPLAIASGPEDRAEIIAISPEAAALGLHPTGSVGQARSMSSGLVVRVASPALERTSREALGDIALSFSPRVALAPRASGYFTCEGAVFLDASGVASLFRSEAGFAAALGARASALGLPGVISIASSRGIAKLIARKLALHRFTGDLGAAEACAILTPESETEVLAPLPIDLLNPSDELAQALTRFGVHSIRDLLNLPERALAQRLGPGILRLVARARGEEVEPPLPEPRDTRLREAIDLDDPANDTAHCAIENLEALSFVIRGLISRLTDRLALRNLACGPIDLTLDLCGGGRDHRRIGVAAPTRDPRVLLRLVVQALETQPPSAAVEGASVSTEGQPGRVDQLDLFRVPGPDPAGLDRTLVELESLCGPGQVGAPAVLDDHRPDVYDVKPFTGSACAVNNTGPPSATSFPTSSLVVRALRPPVRAEIRLSKGRPEAIRSAVACGRVVHASGPWRTTGRWWSEEGRFAMDHYDIQVSDGTILRLRFDWMHRDWQVDAIYD